MQEKESIKTKGAMALSMLIWGTLGLFTRQIGVSSGELALYRALLAILVVGGYLLLTRQKIDLAAVKRELLLLLCSGIAMGINWVLLFEAYRYTTVSIATLSYYFAPVLVMAVCPFLFREMPGKMQVLCFVMSTAGLVLIIGVGGGSAEGRDLIGILLGLGAAVLYASVILMNKYIKEVAGLHRTLCQFIGAVLVLLPYVAFTGGFHLEVLDTTGLVCLLTVGLVHTGLAYCLYFFSLKKLRGQSVAIISYLDPLVAVLLSFLVLKESMTPWQMVGGGLILGFTLLSELKST